MPKDKIFFIVIVFNERCQKRRSNNSLKLSALGLHWAVCFFWSWILVPCEQGPGNKLIES